MQQNHNNAITLEEFDRLYESVKNWGRWGAGDTLGTLNYITPEKIKAAVATVKAGRTVSMSLPVNTVAGPDNPRPAIHYMTLDHNIDIGSGSQRFAKDFIGLDFHGDCHTHVDALCHVAYKGFLYNGVPASSVTVCGAQKLDTTENAHGVVGRGVLIDVPRYRGVKWLEPGEAVTRAELEAVEKAHGLRLGEGDIMVFRTGHHRRRLELGVWDPSSGGQGRAGLTPESITLLHERKVAAFLPDGDGDPWPSCVPGLEFPIHVLQINAMGMLCADSLQFEDLVRVCAEEGRSEFLVMFAPLRVPGGTGSPFNPIAVF